MLVKTWDVTLGSLKYQLLSFLFLLGGDGLGQRGGGGWEYLKAYGGSSLPRLARVGSVLCPWGKTFWCLRMKGSLALRNMVMLHGIHCTSPSLRAGSLFLFLSINTDGQADPPWATAVLLQVTEGTEEGEEGRENTFSSACSDCISLDM
jgi:hypothetical protein